MEIIEIIIFICLLFNLNYETIFFSSIFYLIFMHYRANKHLLIGNPHIFNVFFLFSIFIFESLLIYIKMVLIYFGYSKICYYIYDKCNNLNTYYLVIKNNLISYILIRTNKIYNYLFTRKNNLKKINSEEDGLLFLNRLKAR